MTKNGIVVWLTGLPCSGKTTVSIELEKYLQEKNLPVQRLDGDVVRTTISKDLGFSKEDRDRNIERISYVAQMLSENGVNVITAFVSPYQRMRDFAREMCPNFIEIYVKCSIDSCIARDVKGMYKKALSGEIKDFTGVQDPYEAPEHPDLVLDTEKDTLEKNMENLVRYLERRISK